VTGGFLFIPQFNCGMNKEFDCGMNKMRSGGNH